MSDHGKSICTEYVTVITVTSGNVKKGAHSESPVLGDLW